MPINKLILVSVLVKDQDEAIAFYCDKLGFEKRHDIARDSGNRWVVVSPQKQNEIGIVLRKPHAGDNELITKELDREIGRGTLWTFSTSDCQATYEELRAKGVKFVQKPYNSEFGVEAIFQDIYENRFQLLEVTA